jgi:hypothetical protein
VAVEEGADLHVQAVVLDDEQQPWDEQRLRVAATALEGAGLVPEGEFPEKVEAAVDVPIQGRSGSHTLKLEPAGSWWWTAPFATLMEDSHRARPEAAAEVEAAVRALAGAAPPYFATTWWSTFATPFWMRTDRAFAAEGAGAVTFLSRRYLDEHLKGKPLPKPPARSTRVAGGQLLIVDDGWASNAKTRPLGDNLMRAGR